MLNILSLPDAILRNIINRINDINTIIILANSNIIFNNLKYNLQLIPYILNIYNRYITIDKKKIKFKKNLTFVEKCKNLIECLDEFIYNNFIENIKFYNYNKKYIKNDLFSSIRNIDNCLNNYNLSFLNVERGCKVLPCSADRYSYLYTNYVIGYESLECCINSLYFIGKIYKINLSNKEKIEVYRPYSTKYISFKKANKVININSLCYRNMHINNKLRNNIYLDNDILSIKINNKNIFFKNEFVYPDFSEERYIKNKYYRLSKYFMKKLERTGYNTLNIRALIF